MRGCYNTGNTGTPLPEGKEKMTEVDKKTYVKNQLEDFLTSELGRDFNRDGFINCINPEHPDNNPSMALYRDKNGNQRVKCMSCESNYDIFDAMAIRYNLSMEGSEKFQKTYSYYGVEDAYQNQSKIEQSTHKDIHTSSYTHPQQRKTEDFTDYYRECFKRINEIDYPDNRGLSPEIIIRAHLGYDPHFSRGTGQGEWEALIIPVSPTSFVARNISPDADVKDRYRKIGSNNLYGYDAIKHSNDKPIFIVEGEMDVLSIMTAGGYAIATGSTSNTNKLLEAFREDRPQQEFILALDNDERGNMASNKLLQELQQIGIKSYKINPYGENADANEALLTDKASFTGFIEKVMEADSVEEIAKEAELEEYQKTNTASHLEAFINGIADSVNTPYYPTGFELLDKLLDGGLYEGLYTIGAVSSLGKTTFITQILDQIAQQGHDVMIFSLEMARTELMAKSISRHTIIDVLENNGDIKDAKTSRGITTGSRYAGYNPTELALIEKSIQEYGKYADNIYIHEGIGDIGIEEVRQTVEKHIRITGNHPIVVIDYLQILAPADVRATDKQNTDKSVIELKRLSRDSKVPVIAISSFNRDNYENTVTMKSFKESGAIEYSADVLIGMEFKGAGEKDFHTYKAMRKNPREISVKLLKNRNGAIGDPITYHYYPMFNYFTEKE